MKNFLPKDKLLVGSLLMVVLLFSFQPTVYAQQPQLFFGEFKPENVQEPPVYPGVTLPADEDWVKDKDVTFAGKLAARSKDVLNWTLNNYKWSTDTLPFRSIWIIIRNTVYALVSLLILAAAFLLIITRGRSLTIKKFLPGFVLVLILITLSFALIQFLYQLTDIIQGFFLRRDGQIISGANLLDVGFDYQSFEGAKKFGRSFSESVFVSTWLVKLTAITYFVMSAVLILRKVILWFFLIISPAFSLLLLFPAWRNTSKLWLGEFLRWLLYGPLFSMMLAGLVAIWTIAIPLNFACHPGVDPQQRYPTAINILLGGPCQQVRERNSLNSPETFIQYGVALMMLWVVIILPFILLKIIIDYVRSYSVTESSIIKYLTKASSSMLNHFGQPGSPGVAASDLARSTSIVKSDSPVFTHSPVSQKTETTFKSNLPFRQSPMPDLKITGASQPLPSATTGATIGATMRATGSTASNLPSSDHAGGKVFAPSFAPSASTPGVTVDLLGQTNLRIPTLSDVARFDSGLISRDSPAFNEVSKVYEGLNRIAGRSPIITDKEKEQYTVVKETLVRESENQNPLASSILAATQPTSEVQIPDTNLVQAVSPAEFEQVKSTWEENYRRLTPPPGPDNKAQTRKQWLVQEVHKIPEIIDNLLSGEADRIKQAKEALSKILPFLLLGGFSKDEIIAYLKAKLEAAKKVLAEILQIETEPTDPKIH